MTWIVLGISSCRASLDAGVFDRFVCFLFVCWAAASMRPCLIVHWTHRFVSTSFQLQCHSHYLRHCHFLDDFVWTSRLFSRLSGLACREAASTRSFDDGSFSESLAPIFYLTWIINELKINKRLDFFNIFELMLLKINVFRLKYKRYNDKKIFC